MNRLFIILAFISISCSDDSEEVFSCEELTITLSELEYTDCGGSNGTLRVLAKGGLEPYKFWLNDQDFQTSNLFSDLDSKYYTIHVEDANACRDSVRAFLGSVEAVRAIALTEPSGCGAQNGSIKVIAKNGKLPYRYQLGENAEYTFNDTFSGLSSGIYSVWVKDDRDCFLGIYPIVLSGASMDQIKDILEINCSTSGCHDSSISPNFTDDSEIESNSQEIVESINQDHQSIVLDVEEIELIRCWANDIELENQ